MLHSLVLFFPLARKTFLRKNTYLFNLDCHISVIREIKKVADANDVRIVSWSISKHNQIIRKLFKFPDPVAFVGADSWRLLNPERIRRFQFFYGFFLKSFDGFVVTYPTAFTQLYLKYDKPILVICPTRYEIPYTSKPELWKCLNKDLKSGISRGIVTLFTNSKAEQKYLKYYSGIESEIIHNVCDYIDSQWNPKSSDFIFFSRSEDISNQIVKLTQDSWKEANKFLGANYSWEKLMSVSGVFVLPYNNNTMHLFELASAGMPVIVPSKKFLLELWETSSESGVMSEISNYKVFSISTDGLPEDDPSNYLSPKFKEYWLDLCDFYDRDLMPNVSEIDSFLELLNFNSTTSLRDNTEQRNSRLKNLRDQKLGTFFRTIRQRQ